MGSALHRLWLETTAHFSMLSGRRPRRTGSTTENPATESRSMVGEYEADYGPVPRNELSAADPEIEAVLARSTVVSAKRGP